MHLSEGEEYASFGWKLCELGMLMSCYGVIGLLNFCELEGWFI
jgi:hypothetical protein